MTIAPHVDPESPPSESATDVLEAGAMVGRYIIVSVLGSGGMGVVYSAYDTKLDRKLAIKVLRPDVDEGGEEPQARLLREAQAMARLTHPNVVAIYDVGTIGERVFLAMEFVDGTTLRDWLRTRRPWRERLSLLKAAGRGLSAAHAAGIVHRDFKPDNVLVGRDGRVLVTDFGLARATGEIVSAVPREIASHASLPSFAAAVSASSPAASAVESSLPQSYSQLNDPLTLTGGIVGTVGYMPLEQVLGEVTNASTDQFSYCATLYVALYGERPFAGDSIHAYADALSRPVRDAPKGSDIPAWVRRILLKGLSADPRARFPSMDALLTALDHDPAVMRRRWITAGGAVILSALALVAYRRQAQKPSELCVAGSRELAAVWDDAAHDEMRQHFAAAAGPMGADAFARVAKVLDAYVASWAVMRTEACEATRVRKEQPEDVYRLRVDCLERANTEFAALTSMLRHVEETTIPISVKATYGLPSLSWCADVNGLRASAGLPDDPARRTRVVEARSELAKATSLSLAGKQSAALATAEGARSIARAAGHVATEAESLLRIGYFRRRMGDYAGAEPALKEATWTAQSAGNDAITVQAAGLEGFIVGTKLGRRDEAALWLAMARATLGRLGGSEELDAYVAETEAVLLAESDWRPELAVPIQERVVVAYERLFKSHPRTETALFNLASYNVEQGHHDVAVTLGARVLAMSEALYGPDNPDRAYALYLMGDARVGLGDLAEATRVLEQALPIFDRAGNDYFSALTLDSLARAASARGDTAGAATLARRILAIVEKLHTTLHVAATSSVAAADALLATGHAQEALAVCDRALAAQETMWRLEAERVYGWDALRCRGDALLSLGRPHDALASLERSVSLPRRIYPGDLARARFALARALVQSGGDRARARTLASLAQGELAHLPHLSAQLVVVERWLARDGSARSPASDAGRVR